MKNFEVILILWDRENTFCLPDVNNSIGNHASVAASASSAERVCMINKELTGEALDNQPGLVRR